MKVAGRIGAKTFFCHCARIHEYEIVRSCPAKQSATEAVAAYVDEPLRPFHSMREAGRSGGSESCWFTCSAGGSRRSGTPAASRAADAMLFERVSCPKKASKTRIVWRAKSPTHHERQAKKTELPVFLPRTSHGASCAFPMLGTVDPFANTPRALSGTLLYDSYHDNGCSSCVVRSSGVAGPRVS